jgi:hypothetical protein
MKNRGELQNYVFLILRKKVMFFMLKGGLTKTEYLNFLNDFVKSRKVRIKKSEDYLVIYGY